MYTAIKILSSFICFMMLSVPTAFSLGPERRQEQFSTIPGYLVFPAPYVFPGIGEGLMLVGYSGNFLETTIDAYLVGFSGDAAGLVGSVDEVFVVPELIYFSGWKFNISKYGINSYSSRGMESEKDDFNIIVGNKFEMDIFKVSLSLFERRLEAALLSQTQYGESHKILDSKGNLLNEIDPPQTFQGKKEGIELQLDWTDDFKDPRTGLRLKSTYDLNTSEDADSPEYYLTSHGLTFYQPVFGESTWAFHFFRSDAKVRKEGYTDLKTALLAEGLNEEHATSCSYAPTSEACASYVNKAQNTINANRNGTAHPLGGQDRLRSYPGNRYQAAHTLFYGTELRWNFDTSTEVLDWYFFSDVLQALQATVFWEQGSVSEEAQDLGKITRSSYGGGLRLVGGSGNTYRFEISTGEEGAEMIVMFQYPWRGEM